MIENNENSGSRFESIQDTGSNEGLIKLVLALIIFFGVVFWIAKDVEFPEEREFDEDEFFEEAITEYPIEESAEIVVVEEELVEEEEEKTMDFYYKRALKREKDKDFKGAVEDYEQTILMAKKYSSEMWNSLNNVGIIKAERFKNYKGALKHFNKIISIETNRYDGEINAIRLEAGYTNRAYVKKQLGNTEGACDDLYEALGLGVENSVTFIEKQIDKNCL